MKFNFKKVASVIASAVMISSTVGYAAAASTYPAPFVSGGSVAGAIVVGANAAPSDFFAALDVQKNLNAVAAPSTSTTSTTTVTGGDSINLASSSQRLYYGSALNAAKTSIGKSEMPTLLKDGTVEDDQGTSYTYTQSLTLGSNTIGYDAPGDLKDPEVIVSGSTDVSNPLYTYKVNFNKNINVTSSDVQGNEIELFGKKFTIGSGSSVADGVLYLYGTGQSVTLNEGEETTVKIGDTDHTIKITAVTQPNTGNNQVSVTVDGGTVRKISEGSSTKIGGLDIYAKSVTYSQKDTTTNAATLNIGSETLKLQNGQNVYYGSDEDSIQNTAVVLTSAGGKLSGIAVNISMQDSDTGFIKVGGSYVDPVFGGLKLNFAALNPTLKDESRDAISINTNGNKDARVKFNTALETSTDSLVYAHNNGSSSTFTPYLADNDGKLIHVKEGEAVYKNQYMVVNSGDYGRIVQLDSVPTGTISQNGATLKMTDAISGKEWVSVTVNTTGDAQANADGQTYYFKVANATSDTSNVKITWGAGSGFGTVGDETTLFPRIKLKDGEWLAFLTQTTLTNSSKYVLPGTEALATYESGVTYVNNTGLGSSIKVGNVNYTVTAPAGQGMITGVDTNSDGTVDCNFNSSKGPALLIVEEKKTSETLNSDNGDAVCIPLSTYGSDLKMAIGTPVATGTSSGFKSWDTDSDVSSDVTRYGTYIEYNSNEQGKADVAYPNEQMYADVLFTSEGATVTPGSVGGGSGGTVAIVKDNQVDSVKDMNLVVVGGSCINSVAAKILGSDSPLCGADFSAQTKVSTGGYIIKTVASPYNAGKVAMLVAGYNADDTDSAVKMVLTGVATDVNSTKTFPEVTTSP